MPTGTAWGTARIDRNDVGLGAASVRIARAFLPTDRPFLVSFLHWRTERRVTASDDWFNPRQAD